MEIPPNTIIGIVGLVLAFPSTIAIGVQAFRWWKRFGNHDGPRETSAVVSSTSQPRREAASNFGSIRRMEEGQVYLTMTIVTSLDTLSPPGIASAREFVEVEDEPDAAS